MSTITATGFFPSADGFSLQQSAIIYAVGGTAITASLEFKTSEGNWVQLPDSGGNSSFTADWMFALTAGYGLMYRINVTAVTGTWDWSYTPGT